jgi:RHS repeat-associated protein
VQAVAGGVTATYEYDALGRRNTRTVQGLKLEFAYSGDDLIAEYDGNGNLARKYIQGFSIDEPLALVNSNNIYFYHTDASSTVVALSGSSGSIVEQYVSDVFGKVQQYLSTLGNRFLFAGREYDAESGLYYCRARHYDPGLGRFIQADPMRLLGGLNLYSYCDNNPASFLDPLGLAKDGGFWTRVFGGLQAIGGLAEAGAGFGFAIFTAPTVVGTVAGTAVGLHGVDQFQAGLRTAFTGESTDTFTSTGLQEMGVPRGWANGIDAGISIVGTAGIGVAQASANAARLRALSEANISGSGRTVLGHYPGYIDKAQRTGASYFDIGDTWNSLTPAQRTAANRHFLDKIADAGDQVYLSVSKTKIRPGSSLADEVQYLINERGYQWINQWSLRLLGE